ncbi:energy transducer TonB [Inhella gelatinilytica]|uniref:TonB family protein n=1 Tax=Inhella gelatinilytica TaxID=2795030 RepID=A0A931IVN3_9BURK|nr:energy transducer TonB [Inhella gelatinilytica]MBH9553660.1 TonB family protein [Inhella gelatinilytica]
MLLRSLLALTLTLSATLAFAAPKVVKKVAPEFPAEAARQHVNNGTVRAKLTITGDGKVSEVEIVEAQPRRVFDRAAVEALKEWRFEAAGEKQTHEVRLVFNNDE